MFCLVVIGWPYGFELDLDAQGVPKQTHFQDAAGATVHWFNHYLPATLVPID